MAEVQNERVGVATIHRKRIAPLLAVLTICFSSCATLPQYRHVKATTSPAAHAVIVEGNDVIDGHSANTVLDEMVAEGNLTEHLKDHVRFMQAISGRPLIAGNDGHPIDSGAKAFAEMLKDMNAARHYIHLETYIFYNDDVGQKFAEVMKRKARQGVSVAVIYDSYGSTQTPRSFFDDMRQAGVQVLEFNPFNPLRRERGWPNSRDHRKILILDGKVAFTGGVNLYGAYMPSSIGKSNYGNVELPMKDMHVRIAGPAAVEFERLFEETWGRKNGPPLPKRNYLPKVAPRGDEYVRVVDNSPGAKNRAAYLMYLSAIDGATHYVHITSPYFVPSSAIVEAMQHAAKRGVKIRIIVPAESDSRLALWAGKHRYGELLEHGIEIYEHHGPMLHAKTIVVDGVWATVGSTNMDLRSFALNDEVNAIVLGRDFAKGVEQAFQRERENSTKVSLNEWKKRALKDRVLQTYSNLLRPLL